MRIIIEIDENEDVSVGTETQTHPAKESTERYDVSSSAVEAAPAGATDVINVGQAPMTSQETAQSETEPTTESETINIGEAPPR